MKRKALNGLRLKKNTISALNDEIARNINGGCNGYNSCVGLCGPPRRTHGVTGCGACA